MNAAPVGSAGAAAHGRESDRAGRVEAMFTRPGSTLSRAASTARTASPALSAPEINDAGASFEVDCELQMTACARATCTTCSRSACRSVTLYPEVRTGVYTIPRSGQPRLESRQSAGDTLTT